MGTSTDAAAPTNMNARAMSEDIKRVLQGARHERRVSPRSTPRGGGKRAQAERTAGGRRKADADQSGKDTSAAAAKDTSHLRKGSEAADARAG